MTAGDFELGTFGIGDNAFMFSLYPSLPGTDKNTPIMRTGTVAMQPLEAVRSQYGPPQEAIIVEATSLGGTSGSPAFVEHRTYRSVGLTQPVITNAPRFIKCLGLVSGHFETHLGADKSQVLNERLVIVIPAWKIYQVLFGAELVAERSVWWDKKLEPPA